MEETEEDLGKTLFKSKYTKTYIFTLYINFNYLY